MFDESLTEVLCETAEQMFFQEFSDHPDARPPDRVFWATVDVHSPKDFQVVVAAAETQIRDAIEAVFMDGNSDEARILDVVSELANTIAGSISRHLSNDAILELSPPAHGLGHAPASERYHAFEADDLTLYVSVKGLAHAAE